MVIESWLGDVTPRQSRGSVLAFYSVICLAGLGVGQLLMGLSAYDREPLFLLAGLMLSLAIIPVGLTRVGSPNPIPAMEFRMSGLLRASRVSVVCAGLAGLVTSAFWALGPLLAGEFGLDNSRVGLLMSVGIAGGAACHLPVGRMSDKFDRRIVIGAVASAGTVFGVLGALYADMSPLLLYAAFFLIGAASMPLYSLCIALASDQSQLSLVEITSSVLLINGIGSVVGPVIASLAIAQFGGRAYFIHCAVCLFLVAAWTTYRVIVVEQHAEREIDASILPRTTQAIAGLAQAEPSAPPADFAHEQPTP
jgi:MFS family permease